MDYLSRPESQAALLHNSVHEGEYSAAPILRRKFDLATAIAEQSAESATMSVCGTRQPKQDFPENLGEPRLKSTRPLVSLRRYATSLHSLALAEEELDYLEKSEYPILDKNATFPWKSAIDPDTEKPCWINVETGSLLFEQPARVWEQKLDDLGHLKPVGHVRRAKRRAHGMDLAAFVPTLDTIFRSEQRLDATVNGWEWEEDDTDARRRSYALRAVQKRAHDESLRRRGRPSHCEAIASVIAQLISRVECRLREETDRLARCNRRIVRSTWHPMQRWLVRKLASLTSEPSALMSQFEKLSEKELTDEEARIEAVQHDDASAEFVEHWEQAESRKKRMHRDIEIALRWAHREAGSENFTAGTVDDDADDNDEPRIPVRKRELFATLCEVPTCSWAVQLPQGPALAPLLQQQDFAIAFLLAPVEQPGYMSAEEFVLFGLVVADIEPKLQQVRQDLTNHHKVSGARRWNHKTADLGKEMSSDFRKSWDMTPQLASSAVQDDPGDWARSHTHIMVRLNGAATYCCLCRRNRVSIQTRATQEAEATWAAEWSTTRERRLDDLVHNICHEVDNQRRAKRLEESQRIEVALTLQTVVDRISADEEGEIITSALLRAAVSHKWI